MLIKRFALVIALVLMTVLCLVFMNRNYDPLARYSYFISDETRQIILDNLDDRELKYIVDYAIAPEEYMSYIHSYNFNAYHIAQYNKASEKLIRLYPNQVVTVVELAIKKNIDPDAGLDKYMYLDYDTIVRDLNKK